MAANYITDTSARALAKLEPVGLARRRHAIVADFVQALLTHEGEPIEFTADSLECVIRPLIEKHAADLRRLFNWRPDRCESAAAITRRVLPMAGFHLYAAQRKMVNGERLRYYRIDAEVLGAQFVLAHLERLRTLGNRDDGDIIHLHQSRKPLKFRWSYTEKHLCSLIEANVQQVAVALNLPPVVEATREYQMPAMRADFVFRHIDGTHTLVEVKTGNVKQSIVRQMHGALGQGMFYMSAYSTIEQVDMSKVRLCLLVDFDIDEDAFLENTLTTALERIDMPITVVNVIRLLGLTDGAQQPLL